MISLRAIIRLSPAEEGGQGTDGFSGMQPSILISGDLVACKIVPHESDVIKRGVEYNVMIELPYGEIYSSKVFVGMKFSLNIGGKVIGNGVVVD